MNRYDERVEEVTRKEGKTGTVEEGVEGGRVGGGTFTGVATGWAYHLDVETLKGPFICRCKKFDLCFISC